MRAPCTELCQPLQDLLQPLPPLGDIMMCDERQNLAYRGIGRISLHAGARFRYSTLRCQTPPTRHDCGPEERADPRWFHRFHRIPEWRAPSCIFDDIGHRKPHHKSYNVATRGQKTSTNISE